MISAVCNLIKWLWAIQFLRFLAVGAVNTAFGYGVFASLILLNLNYMVAALLGQICGVLFNFKTTGTFVFRNRNNKLIFKFIGVYLVTYLITIGTLKGLALCGIGNLIGGAIIVLPIALLSFTMNKKFVFMVASKWRREVCDEKPVA